MSVHLPEQQKLKILKSLEKGSSVTKLARRYGVSRTSLYAWFKEYNSIPSLKGLESNGVKQKRHWKKLEKGKSKDVLRVALNHTQYTIKEIAEAAQVSTFFVWQVLHGLDITTKEKRTAYRLSHGIGFIKRLNEYERIQLVQRGAAGECVAALCREYGITRTTYYSLQNRFENAKKDKNSLVDNRARGVKHYRYNRSLEKITLELIIKSPELSYRKLADSVSQKHKKQISTYYVYSTLRKHGLTNQLTRYAVLTDKNSAVIQYLDLLKRDKKSHLYQLFTRDSNFDIADHFINGMVFPLGCASVLLVSICVFKPVHDSTSTFISDAIQPSIEKTLLASGLHSSQSDVHMRKEVVSNQKKEMLNQDLAWGVLAVNMTKQKYSIGEKNTIELDVLNNKGIAECDADLSVTIHDPKGNKQTYSTSDSSIRALSSCGVQRSMSDYQVDYVGKQSGTYTIDFSAHGKDGKEHTLSSWFEVGDPDAVTISRIGSGTRVWPLDGYTMKLLVTSDKERTVTVDENIPLAFTVLGSGGAGVTRTASSQRLEWQVHVLPGEVKELSYIFITPSKSPAFYTLDPVVIHDANTNRVLIQEQRHWQLAIDAL